MARDAERRRKEGRRAMIIQATGAGKIVRAQLDRLLPLRRRLQQLQRSPAAGADDDAAVLQEVAGGLFKVYYTGLSCASRYITSFFMIAADSGAGFALRNPAFAVIPDEQLYGVLLAHGLPARPTTQAEAFARIENAVYAIKLAEEHHIPRCIELLVGVRPPNVTGKSSPFSGMPRYSNDPISAAHEHLAENGFPNPALATDEAPASAAATGKDPKAPSSMELDQALSYLYRACSLASLAVKHIDLAVAFFSSSFDPKEVAEISEMADKYTFIPEE